MVEELVWRLIQLNLKTSEDGDPSASLGPCFSVFLSHCDYFFFYNQVELPLLQHVLIASCLLCLTPPRTGLFCLLCISPLVGSRSSPSLFVTLSKLSFGENWFVLFHFHPTSTSSSTSSSLSFLYASLYPTLHSSF